MNEQKGTAGLVTCSNGFPAPAADVQQFEQLVHAQLGRVALSGAVPYLGVPRRFPAPSSSVAERWKRCATPGRAGGCGSGASIYLRADRTVRTVTRTTEPSQGFSGVSHPVDLIPLAVSKESVCSP